MNRKIVAAVMLGLLVVAGFGCSGKKEPVQNKTVSDNQLPPGHPSTGGAKAEKPTGKPVDGKQVEAKIMKALDAKYPGEWTVSGTKLNKGSYTENNNYGIVDEVKNIYQGSMVSMFVGEKRISSTIRGQDFSSYETPPEVADTIKTGKISVVAGGSMGSTSYQKVYIPIKSGGKTMIVMTVSMPQ